MTQGHQRSVVAPAEINGWKATGERKYRKRQLYDYIDGGAELYLSYGFNSLASRDYTRPGQPDITLDCFDMGSSHNAFGVFSQSREKIEKDAGQGSEYASGQMIFWKDRYYVSIMSQKETAESKRAVFALARSVADAIPNEGPLPAILNLLPKGELAPESVRYFRHHVWLNSHYYISDQNILRINEKTDAVLAKYGRGLRRTVLLLIEYPDDTEVRLAREDFTERYLPEIVGRRAVRIEDGTWTACDSNGRVFVAVFNASTEQAALRLIDAVRKMMIKSQKQEPEHE
ncbi:MAG: hypothetical protein A2176_06935 [Spirochaetes bacterium RBG_13_51_14]|nr:MAG: hypothetical protein A2176_06935 [Spirochaetes bacterium RBG_13_51_14]